MLSCSKHWVYFPVSSFAVDFFLRKCSGRHVLQINHEIVEVYALKHVIITILPVYAIVHLFLHFWCYYPFIDFYTCSVTVLTKLTMYDICFTCGIKCAHSSRVLYHNSKPTHIDENKYNECLVRHTILTAYATTVKPLWKGHPLIQDTSLNRTHFPFPSTVLVYILTSEIWTPL